MKEATGELSTTVIAVVAIAAISALFVVLLLPRLRANIMLGQACGNEPGYHAEDGDVTVDCDDTPVNNEWTCTYERGTLQVEKKCSNNQ